MPYKNADKRKEYLREWQQKVRQELYTYKESKPCVDCGNFYSHYVMQFDHTGTDKKFTISSHSASYGGKRIFEEIEKCDLVCANCHAIRTYNRRFSGRVGQGAGVKLP